MNHSLDCRNAWLSPNGQLRPNLGGYAEHNKEAHNIVTELGMIDLPTNAESHLINLGWVKLRASEWCLYKGAEKLIQRQRDTIFDWCMKAQAALPSFMAPDNESEPVGC